MTTLFAAEALLPAGWQRDVLIDIDETGHITAVRKGKRGEAEDSGGPVLPGMSNTHSHAFQRAMAGLAEHLGSAEDSFWTWREVMYGFLKTLGPAEVEAIAGQLYVENLKTATPRSESFTTCTMPRMANLMPTAMKWPSPSFAQPKLRVSP